MAKTTIDTIDELLAGVMEDVEGSEARYKLRNARQLVEVVRQRHHDLDEAIEDSVDDEEILEDLRDLGYVE